MLALAGTAGISLSLLGAGVASAHGLFGFGSQATPEQIAQAQTNRFTQEASLLGISVDDVKNAWAKGETLQQLATEHGITTGQLQQKLKDAALQRMKDNLQTLVTQGVITQAQADARLQFMQTQSQNNSSKGFGHRGMGMMGRMGL